MELLVLARRRGVMLIHYCRHPLLRASLFAVSFYLVMTIGLSLVGYPDAMYLFFCHVSLLLFLCRVTSSLGMLLLEWLSADMPSD